MRCHGLTHLKLLLPLLTETETISCSPVLILLPRPDHLLFTLFDRADGWIR
jgi:hypothetical protein